MGKITVLPETTKNPITLMGQRAGICTGADITDPEKNYKRGIDCIESNHGRCEEFPDVHLIIEGYSARVIREWYTHIGGMPTRLQESTRYVGCNNFDYVTPPSVKNNSEADKIFVETMSFIHENASKLRALGIPKEDVAMIYPLGMTTKIVDKRNLRNYIDMSRNRMCSRAYWEFRELFNDIKTALSEYSDEWEEVIRLTFMPKCEYLGYCPEKRRCERKK